MKPGIYNDVTIFDYHKKYVDIVSNSYLGKLNQCPAKAKILDEDTTSLIIGRAVHKYVLEHDLFENEFAVLKEKLDLRTNAGKEGMRKFQSEHTGKQILSMADFAKIKEMYDAIMSNPMVAVFLKDIRTEVTVIWEDTDYVATNGDCIEGTGLFCKCRPDVIPNTAEGAILDLKTTKSAEEHPFQTSVIRYGYDRQAAMTLHGLERITGKRYDVFGIIAVETEPPYRTEIYALDEELIRRGFGEFRRLMRIEKHCREQNYWPNYKPESMLDLRKAPVRTIMKPGYLSVDSGVWEMQE